MSTADPLPLPAYSPLISLLTPFVAPPPPAGPAAAAALEAAIVYLWCEKQRDSEDHSDDKTTIVRALELDEKIRVFQQLLTIRGAETPLPTKIRDYVDSVIRYLATKKPQLTPVSRVQPLAGFLPPASLPLPLPQLQKISLWRGDITTLGVTAIVNAANSRMLGCFTPGHKCIDNVIHDAAGPRLREDCKIIMDAQGFLEPTGTVKVTRGYNTPAKYVLHTVGPKIPTRAPGEARVKPFEKEELKGCYRSCLEAMEELPHEAEGKTVAFCCISTGVFGYPADEAVHTAVDTVLEYFEQNPSSSVTQVVFNVFTPADLALYIQKFNTLIAVSTSRVLSTSDFTTSSPSTLTPSSQTAISLAANWLSSSGALLITAGAGLSASDGLDYTSTDLFRTHFPGMHARGFRTLYDLFGFTAWSSPREKWGYYFSHLLFVQSWNIPSNSVYLRLQALVTRLNKPFFIRTSNADCLFARSGFPRTHIATPQGSYELLQCMAKCRVDAVFDAQPYIDVARPYLDQPACVLRDEPGWETAVPKCPWCAGEMFLCVRGGDYFNEAPFMGGDGRYGEFVAAWVKEDTTRMMRGGEGGELVVLELGAGFNTPAVIRWPNEKLLAGGKGRVKLVRVGMKGGEMVDWNIGGVTAVGIDGDAGVVVAALLEKIGI
ncbi:hypothetical protein Q9L58_001148 [Maublancomyces gigas]|uniref:ADP-ribose 1''-phosphate phosphatase n=1 Tax=Discina gigas TaxID=1032678 RepID=A0ABR3GVA0_9PEZI